MAMRTREATRPAFVPNASRVAAETALREAALAAAGAGAPAPEAPKAPKAPVETLRERANRLKAEANAAKRSLNAILTRPESNTTRRLGERRARNYAAKKAAEAEAAKAEANAANAAANAAAPAAAALLPVHAAPAPAPAVTFESLIPIATGRYGRQLEELTEGELNELRTLYPKAMNEFDTIMKERLTMTLGDWRRSRQAKGKSNISTFSPNMLAKFRKVYPMVAMGYNEEVRRKEAIAAEEAAAAAERASKAAAPAPKPATAAPAPKPAAPINARAALSATAHLRAMRPGAGEPMLAHPGYGSPASMRVFHGNGTESSNLVLPIAPAAPPASQGGFWSTVGSITMGGLRLAGQALGMVGEVTSAAAPHIPGMVAHAVGDLHTAARGVEEVFNAVAAAGGDMYGTPAGAGAGGPPSGTRPRATRTARAGAGGPPYEPPYEPPAGAWGAPYEPPYEPPAEAGAGAGGPHIREREFNVGIPSSRRGLHRGQRFVSQAQAIANATPKTGPNAAPAYGTRGSAVSAHTRSHKKPKGRRTRRHRRSN